MKQRIFKRIRKSILCIALVFSLMMPMFSNAAPTIDPNLLGGGGGLGNGSEGYYWNETYEGVRVTLVDVETGEVKSASIDLSNNDTSIIQLSFGEVCKTSYKNGQALSVDTGSYSSVRPGDPLPRIISINNRSNNTEELRSYFTDVGILQYIAGIIGIDYDTMISGEYKLLIEPIAYIVCGGVWTALTATEAALYNRQTGGVIRSYFASLTHMNLPFAIYLERDDLGYHAWTGSTNERVDDATIISDLGVGIVRFTDEYIPSTPSTTVQVPDYTYRTDTDVITSVYVSGSTQADPDSSVTVTFNILGTNYNVTNVYYPANGGQLVWVRWHTPSNPQTVNITVSASTGTSVSDSTITCSIVDLAENPPPNPTADDRNDAYSYSSAVMPNNTELTSTAWTRWGASWHQNWVWHSDWNWYSTGHTSSCRRNCTIRHGYWQDEGEYVDEGWWVLYQTTFYASLSATATVSPDALDPTAGADTIKSGYGINESVNTRMRAWYYYTDNNGETQIQNITYSGMITPAQNAQSWFPEFYYQTYWRNLQITISGYENTLEFKNNVFSTYNNRTHFTPVWMRDGTYSVYTWVFDAWTPNGMLSTNINDSVTINGNLWDDWHIAPQNPD